MAEETTTFGFSGVGIAIRVVIQTESGLGSPILFIGRQFVSA